MNPEIQVLKQQIIQLQSRIQNLESKASNQGRGTEFEEAIRNVIFFTNDPISPRSTQHTITFGAGGGTDTFTLPNAPDIYLRGYFRGKQYNFPGYLIP